MDNQKEFIRNAFNEIVLTFKNVICRYEYHTLSDAHYVEINPSDVFQTDQLKEQMTNIMFSFYDSFPEDNIVFLTEDDNIGLEWPEFTVKGENFVPKWSVALHKSFTEVDIEPYCEEMNYFLAA